MSWALLTGETASGNSSEFILGRRHSNFIHPSSLNNFFPANELQLHVVYGYRDVQIVHIDLYEVYTCYCQTTHAIVDY